MTCLSNNDIVKAGATAKDTLELARFLTSNLKLSKLSKLSKALDVRTFVEEATYSFIFTSIFFRDIDDCTLILTRIKKRAKGSENLLWSYCTDEIQKCQNLSDVENFFIRSGQLLAELARCKGVEKAAAERENHQPVENGEQLGSSGLGSSPWPKNESSKSGLRNSGPWVRGAASNSR